MGEISLLVLGELYLSLFKNFTDNLERTEAFQIINGIIQHLDFNIVTLEIPHYLYCIEKVKKTDSRLDLTDTKLLAEAFGSESSAFITIDKKILDSTRLNTLMKTAHPEDMI